MQSNLKLIENIAENIKNELWDAAYDDICLITRPKGYIKRIKAAMTTDGPNSEEDERWIKAVAPLLTGEYACGNI